MDLQISEKAEQSPARRIEGKKGFVCAEERGLQIAVAFAAAFLAGVEGCIERSPPGVAGAANALDAGLDARAFPRGAGALAVGPNVVVDGEAFAVPVFGVGVAGLVGDGSFLQAGGSAFGEGEAGFEIAFVVDLTTVAAV